MAKKRKKRLDLTKPPTRLRMPVSILIRMFVIGSIGVFAAAYAIYRHYYVPRPSMLGPAPTATATATTEALAPDLLPAPELIPADQ